MYHKLYGFQHFLNSFGFFVLTIHEVLETLLRMASAATRLQMSLNLGRVDHCSQPDRAVHILILIPRELEKVSLFETSLVPISGFRKKERLGGTADDVQTAPG